MTLTNNETDTNIYVFIGINVVLEVKHCLHSNTNFDAECFYHHWCIANFDDDIDVDANVRKCEHSIREQLFINL